jgi:hydroxymethylpyrimidine kinase/phosphomethylpyrimidine kinase
VPTSSAPVAWTIAGSDSGGGAGIQADLKVMNAFGVHGCSVVTALTAQNTCGVRATEPVSESMLRAQFDTLASDLPPAAIKTGMLGAPRACEILADGLSSHPNPIAPLICDPVLKSTSGTDLLAAEALDVLINRIFPLVDILTPNLPEAEAITGRHFESMEDAADAILALGPNSVLIKGGHAEGDECIDYWTDSKQVLWLSSPRIVAAATHGTGCILSAAIASALALGQPVQSALATAKTYLNQCLKSPANVGTGRGPMRIERFRNDPADRPQIKTS